MPWTQSQKPQENKMERILLISDRATKAEQGSVAVYMDVNQYANSTEPKEETLIRLVKIAMRMRPDRIVIDTMDESILALPEKDSIPADSLQSFREKRLWKVASQVLNGEYIYQCYQRRYVHEVDCAGDRNYDSEIYRDREKAAARCRKLNAPLLPPVEGWIADGHPQNY